MSLWQRAGFGPTGHWQTLAALERLDRRWVARVLARAREVQVAPATLAHMEWFLPGWAPHVRAVKAGLAELPTKERMTCRLWMNEQRRAL